MAKRKKIKWINEWEMSDEERRREELLDRLFNQHEFPEAIDTEDLKIRRSHCNKYGVYNANVEIKRVKPKGFIKAGIKTAKYIGYIEGEIGNPAMENMELMIEIDDADFNHLVKRYYFDRGRWVREDRARRYNY